MKKLLAIDFEYRGSNNAKLDLVSVALHDSTKKNSKSVWLYRHEKNKEVLKKYLLGIRGSHVLVCFNASAEGRALISLGLNPAKFKWIDIQAEYKNLKNQNYDIEYGRQLIKGVPKFTTPPPSYDVIEDHKPHNRAETNLLAVTYKLLGIVEDAAYKDYMRDLILYSKKFTRYNVKQILQYGQSDISNLFELLTELKAHFIHIYRIKSKSDLAILYKEMLYRGETVARQSIIEAVGYPVNREHVTNFAKNVPLILKDLQEDINGQFPDREIFKYNKKTDTYSFNTKAVKSWIVSECKFQKDWKRTPKDDYSLALDAWEKFYSYRQNYPRDNLPAQVIRYLRTKQSLNGFLTPSSTLNSSKETFFDYYGSDDRAHPYLNSYGSQSGRYQPKATGFLHLKAAWMRSMVQPKKGRAIISIDYVSQEFLIAGLLSNDKNMLEAYKSGDVYFYFAKKAGAVPKDGKREDYVDIRNKFKATVLGLSYGMREKSLARKLTMDTGIEHDEVDALELIESFEEVFSKYTEYKEEIEEKYFSKRLPYIKLFDGFTMWGDNPNPRSVINMPVQGQGSVILRKAIQYCQNAGLKVILPLHDALYVEVEMANLKSKVKKFKVCMRDAFKDCFPGNNSADLIRLDTCIWSPSLEVEGYSKELESQMYKYYIDSRSKSEYERFSKYFGGSCSQ